MRLGGPRSTSLGSAHCSGARTGLPSVVSSSACVMFSARWILLIVLTLGGGRIHDLGRWRICSSDPGAAGGIGSRVMILWCTARVTRVFGAGVVVVVVAPASISLLYRLYMARGWFMILSNSAPIFEV